MYNGLGLRTARGSGTNGYVQRNLSFAKPRTQGNYQPDLAPPKPTRKPNADVMLHRSKRQIEVECLQYEEELVESQKYSTEEIATKVQLFRSKQLAKLEDTLHRSKSEVLQEQKEKDMDRIKDAFGIRDDAVVGEAFKFESEEKRQERLARYAEEDRVERRKRLRDR